MSLEYKVLALDIDGTLTTSKKVITPETREAVIELQKKGVHVVIASGRSEYGFRHIADELNMAEYGNYIMAFNGGRIIRYSTGEIVYNRPLDLSFLPEIHEIARKYGVGILGYEGDCLVSGNGIDEYQELDAWACKMKLKEVDDFPVHFTAPFNKCLLTGAPDRLAEILPHVKKQLEGRLDVCMSDPYYMEILPYGIHKAAGLEKLLEKLGCSRKELVACGDGGNDLSMIEYAGLGVAMANSIPEVLAKADYVTASNDEDGVLKVIKKFFYI